MTIYTTREIRYGHYGYAAYRIEIDNTVQNRPMQRHIWVCDDGASEQGEWIASARQTHDQLIGNGYSVRSAQ